jgi:phosphoglycerol transferase MdoB-like AlkP superfamily enzyme
VTAIGLLPYHLACLARRLETVLQGESAHREVKRDLRAWVEDRSWRLGATSTASASGASIVIVMVESLQEFVLDLRVDGQEITPFLNRFARSSDLFESAYAQTGNGHTSDAEFSALCSSPAAGEGAVVLDYAENHFRCIGHLAAEHGYATVAAHGNDLSFFHRRTVYPRLGFQSLLDGSIAPEAPSVGFGRLDVPFLQAVAGKLAATRRPYLAHVVTVSSHWPYEVPDAPLPLPSIQNAPLASYLGAIHYADRALGAFYEAVRASGQPEPIFVLFGDHGAFGRNSAAAQEINASQDPDNELAWTDFERRVPLLIHLPGQTAGSVHREVAGQIDLAPTIAALLGFGPPKALWIGRDLFGGRPGALAFHDQSALDDRRLFVSAAAEEPSERCYDRTTSGPLPLADCDGLRALGRRDFESWDKVLQYDLATSLVR